MSKFDHYFQMDVGDVIAYTLEKAPGIGWDRATMEAVVPPEHGNLNYVYRVWDGKGHSIYIKQAGLTARISNDMDKMEVDRDLACPVWDEFKDIVAAHDPRGAEAVGFLERFAFYEAAKKAYAVVSTGETAFYACVILQKGCL